MAGITEHRGFLKGFSLAIAASLLWGVAGTAAQFLFARGITPEWLVCVRMLAAGALLLAVAAAGRGMAVFAPFRNRRDFVTLIVFALCGMLAVQYTYFVAIQYSNAATATVIQYTGPALIVCYYALLRWRLPPLREVLAVMLAMLGVFLIVTHGDPANLALNGAALGWGLAAAVALAAYSILPVGLLQKFDARIVAGWGMLLGGALFSLVHPPWTLPEAWTPEAAAYTAFIIVFGSAIPFIAFFVAIRLLGPTTASLLACVEPIAAAGIAVAWLGVPFGAYDWLGLVLVVLTVAVLARGRAPHP